MTCLNIKDYLDVVKPKQTFLLMITFCVSFLVASNLKIDFIKFTLSFVSVLLAVMGTTALNMKLDSDIDALMPRTRDRPVPSGRISPLHCTFYGAFLYLTGLIISIFTAFQLSIVILLGLLFYIVIYTLILKRRTPYSIILGGFAGAMPSLAGWVAVNGFSLAGFIISAIVLLWIPSHIWYLSIHYYDDYEKAGIPMYPLVAGMRKASWAIVLATGFMLLAESILYLISSLNLVFLVVSQIVTLNFLFKSARFAVSPKRVKAKRMYKLASITLGLIYLAMVLDILI